MTNPGFTLDRNVISGVKGGFIAFGLGKDIDEAFDAAVTTDRFELGSSGLVPSVVDVDPSTDKQIVGEGRHPWEAINLLVGAAANAEQGAVIACSVTTLSAWRQTKTRLVLDDATLELPDQIGLVLPVSTSLDHAVRSALPGGAALVSVELVRPPKRRYKVTATSIKGPRKPGYAVIENGTVLSTHPNSSLARRAAVETAKASQAVRNLEVRPWISRNDTDPYLRVTRAMIAQKAVVKAVTAELKNPEKTKTVGWVFAGRI